MFSILFSEQMGELFRCAEVGNYIRIRTPFMYPDGDYIDIFCDHGSDEGMITLSDLGETVRWLKMQTISPRRSPKQNQMIQDICITHGVEFFQGMLQVRCRPGDNLALAVTRILQAALRIADICCHPYLEFDDTLKLSPTEGSRLVSGE